MPKVGTTLQGGVDDSPPLKSQRPAIWQHITENILTHRSRKVEHEDDIMVCQCRPPRDGGPGCGEDCLNRMLNQECNQVPSLACSLPGLEALSRRFQLCGAEEAGDDGLQEALLPTQPPIFLSRPFKGHRRQVEGCAPKQVVLGWWKQKHNGKGAAISYRWLSSTSKWNVGHP